MRCLYMLLFFTSLLAAQINSGNVTWKSRVETNEIYSILRNGDFIYANTDDIFGVFLNSDHEMHVFEMLQPARIAHPQNLGYYQDSNFQGNIKIINGNILYRCASDVFHNLAIYDINNGLLIPHSTTTIGGIGNPIQFAEIPGQNILLMLRYDGVVYVFDISDPYAPVALYLKGFGSPTVNSLCLANNTIYLGDPSQIRIVEVDLNTPITLTQVNQLSTPAGVEALLAKSNILYASLGSAGIALYDISDPVNPALLGSYDTPGSASEIALNEAATIAYVADNSGLQVLNIADPAAISQVGFHLGIAPEGIQSRNNTVILQEHSQISVVQYNIGTSTSLTFADPFIRLIGIEGGNPVSRVAHIQNNGSAGITINGISVSSSDFIVNDTSFSLNPGEQKPVGITFLTPPTLGAYPGFLTVNHSGVLSPDTLTLSGEVIADYLHVNNFFIDDTPLGDTSSSTLSIYNSDLNPYSLTIDSLTVRGRAFSVNPVVNHILPPNSEVTTALFFNPTVAGNISDTITVHYYGTMENHIVTGYGFGPLLHLPGNMLSISSTQVGSVGEKTVFFKNIGNRQFNIVNLDLPAQPFHVEFDTLSIAAGDSFQMEVTFSPQQVGTYPDSVVIEHNEFTSPTVVHLTGLGVSGNVANMTLLGGRDTPGRTEGLTLNGSFVFLADSGNGIVAMNIVDPQTIAISDKLTLSSELHRIEMDGSNGYAVAENGFFYTLDASIPSALALLDLLPLPGTPNDIALKGLYAYVSAGTEGLRIVNISDPANPFQLSFLSLPGFASGVAVAGDYAFVACGDSGLQIADVSNLFNPFVAAALLLPGSANELLLEGNRLFVSLEDTGVQMVDVTDPLQPQLQQLIDVIGKSADLATAGDTLYVAAQQSGVRVHDVSKAGAPEIAFYELPTEVYSLTVRGDTVYAAAGNSGLFIMQLAGGLVGTGALQTELITDFRLEQNYPNPFNPETRIVFDLPDRSEIELIVYDLLGRQVKMLQRANLPAGRFQTSWNGRDNQGNSMGSGVYVYQLIYETADGGSGSLSRKMVLLK